MKMLKTRGCWGWQAGIGYVAALAFAGTVALVSTPVYAGRTCAEPTMPTKESIENGLNLAKRTMDSLNRSGAQVVLLARAGQDLSKYSVHYSHLGFAYKQRDAAGADVWRILHKLNDCGSAESALYRQGLGNFFMDDLWRYEAVALVPLPEVQSKLLAVITDAGLSAQLNFKPYSMVSYAWGVKYQQSNQWAIETLALAMAPDETRATFTRSQAQAWLRSKAYQPTTLKIGALTRLGARMTAANIAFDDHPDDKRYADRIETVTVDSVIDWMKRAGYTDRIITYPQALSPGQPQERIQQIAPNKDLQAGLEAFKNKEYTRAYELLQPQASMGDKEAQFTLGLILRNGYGRGKDFNEALRWLRMSADQSYSPAEYNLGALYASGAEVPKDYNQAMMWLGRARNHGNPGAAALLTQVQAQKRAEALSATQAAQAVVDGNKIVVTPDPQDAVAQCVRASRVQCTEAESDAWKQDFLKSLHQSVRYPSRAARSGQAGEVLLNVVVCESDTAPHVSVGRSSGVEELDQAAVQAAMSLKVQALTCSGLRAPITFATPISFTLDKGAKTTVR